VRVLGRETMAVGDSVAYDAERGEWRVASERTLPVWVVEEHYGGVSVTSWLDQEGRLVRSESPMGFAIRRVPYEMAEQAWRRSRADPSLAEGYGIVIESTAIASNADLGAMDRGADRLTVRLGNVDLTGFDLDGGRQTLRGDTLVIRREPAAALVGGYDLPYRGGGAPAAELEPTPLVQADDPRIVETATRIAGRVRGPGGGSASPERLGLPIAPEGDHAEHPERVAGPGQRGRATARSTRSSTWRWPGPWGCRPVRPWAWSTWTGASSTTHGPRSGWTSGWRWTPRWGSYPADPSHCGSWWGPGPTGGADPADRPAGAGHHRMDS
jgi:hypothetical protein